MGTNGKRKTVAALAALCILAVPLASACQPTPTKPVVVNKGDGKLAERILGGSTAAPAPSPSPSAGSAGPAETQAASAAAALHAPAHMKDSFTGVDGKLVINVDADILLPDAPAFPVLKVAPGRFTQEQVDRMVAEFMQGKPMYSEKKVLSKKEVQEAIIRMKGELLKEKDEQNRKAIQDSIDGLQETLKTAPETVQRQAPSDGRLEKGTGKGKEPGGYESMQAMADLGKSHPAYITVINTEDGRNTQAQFQNLEGTASLEWPLEGQPRGVSMTPEEARALAERTVADLGSDLKLAQTCVTIVDNVTKSEKDDVNPDLDTLPQAYLFYFTRSAGGVPTTYTQNECASLTGMDDNFTKPWRYEKLKLVVDDTGVVDFEWVSPMQVLGTMAENVQMLQWQDIYDVFKKMIVTSNAWAVSKESGNTKCTYAINRITLGLSRLSSKDNPDEYMLVPVWDFFGYHTIENPRIGEAQKADDLKYSAMAVTMSELTINAVDGSVIDRGFGY